MTPITWQAAVNDEEQWPLLQDILEAAVDDRRQAAVDIEEQRPQLQDEQRLDYQQLICMDSISPHWFYISDSQHT